MADLVCGFSGTLVYEGAFPGAGHAHHKDEGVFEAGDTWSGVNVVYSEKATHLTLHASFWEAITLVVYIYDRSSDQKVDG